MRGRENAHADRHNAGSLKTKLKSKGNGKMTKSFFEVVAVGVFVALKYIIIGFAVILTVVCFIVSCGKVHSLK